MKIIMIDPLLYTLPYDMALADAITERGGKVCFVSRNLEAGEDIEGKSVVHRPISLPPTADTFSGIKSHLYWFYRCLLYVMFLARCRVEIAKFKPDVVHFQWSHIPLLEILFIRLVSRTYPTAITVHDTVVGNGDPSKKIRRMGWQRLLTLFDHVFVHSKDGYERMKVAGIDEKRLHLIGHGPLESFPLHQANPEQADADDVVEFLMFGMIKPYKGVDILIQAASLLNDDVKKKCRFVIAGKPAMDVQLLIDMAADLDVGNLFEFIPKHIPDSDIPLLMNSADVLLFPYRQIDSSGVFMLGLSFSKPMIATSVGIFKELLVSDVHGYLVPTEDIAALKEALEKILDPALRATMSRNVASLYAQLPTWEDAARDTLAAFARS